MSTGLSSSLYEERGRGEKRREREECRLEEGVERMGVENRFFPLEGRPVDQGGWWVFIANRVC